MERFQSSLIVQVEALVPVGVQCSLAHCCCLGLFAVDSRNSKGIGQAYDGQRKMICDEWLSDIRKTSRL